MRLARSEGPLDTTISLSHAQRLANNRAAVSGDGPWVHCTWEPGSTEEEPYRLSPGVRIIGRRTNKLTNGMVYIVLQEQGGDAILEETLLRFGETERRQISVTMEQLERDSALAAGITVASCQGKTLGRTRVQGISSPHMSAENLIVCTNRTRTLHDLRADP